jgi:hypothetical protein
VIGDPNNILSLLVLEMMPMGVRDARSGKDIDKEYRLLHVHDCTENPPIIPAQNVKKMESPDQSAPRATYLFCNSALSMYLSIPSPIP